MKRCACVSLTAEASRRGSFLIGAEGSFAGGSSTAWYPQIERDARATGTLRFFVPAGYTVSLRARKTEKNHAPQPTAGARFSLQSHVHLISLLPPHATLSNDGVAATHPDIRLPSSFAPRIGDFLDRCARVLDALTQELAQTLTVIRARRSTDRTSGTRALDGASGEGFIFSNGNFLDADFTSRITDTNSSSMVGSFNRTNMVGKSRGRLMLDERWRSTGRSAPSRLSKARAPPNATAARVIPAT